MTEFEWDDDKAVENYRKHGIRFEEAVEVFDDPLYKLELNSIVNDEERWQITGMSKTCVLLLVIHTIQENVTEIIRIISARPVTKEERRDYEHR